MSTAYKPRQRHSADVRMHLRVNERIFVIGQLGPDFIVLREPVDCPATDGEITVSIDGRVKRWPVSLPDGIVMRAPQTRIVDCPQRSNGA